MISKEELKRKTGYSSFLDFKRNCYDSAVTFDTPKLTRYFYDETKHVDLNITPQELFIAAEDERKKRI